MHYDLGRVNYSVGNLAAILLPPLPVPATGQLGFASDARATTRFDGDIVRVGVNYAF